MSSIASIDRPPVYARPPTRWITAVGIIIAVWCAGFAGISIWFEATNYFDTGQYAESAAGFSVANWVVTAIKAIGVVVALLAVDHGPRLLAPRVVGTLLWAAFATTGVYVVGSALQSVLMLAGLVGDADEIDFAAVSYVLLFLVAAAGFGILAISYARRAGLGKREMLLGAVGAPVVLGGVLVVLPAILTASGLLVPS
jgi:hypothetical protein